MPMLNNNMDELLQQIRSTYPGVKIWAFESADRIELQQIEVPVDQRDLGIGSKIIRWLQDYAKSVGKPIVLRPEPDKGKKAALNRFYKRLGFVDNSGRNKDYTLSAPFAKTMYWRFKEWLTENE
jgi:GNAT superfamily N-acetyltransferase